MTNLKETLQPPNLEDTLSDDNSQLEDAPPLHTAIGALGGVTVHSLAHNNVSLFIPHLGDSLRKLANYINERSVYSFSQITAQKCCEATGTSVSSAIHTFGLQWILRHFGLGHVDDSVDVERHLLRVGGPALVAEAVGVLAIVGRGERVVFVRDGLLVVLAVSQGILDLDSSDY